MYQQQTVIGIIKKQKGLIEIIDHLFTVNQNGEYNKKVLINLQGEAETGKSKQVSFYLDMDEAKQISYEIRNGLFKNLKYPTYKNQAGNGNLYFLRGNKWGRSLKIDGSNDNYMSIAVGNYKGDPSKSRNGETVLSEKIDEHKFNLTSFEARILFGKLFDYIDKWETHMMFQQDEFTNSQPVQQEKPAKIEQNDYQNEQTQEQKEEELEKTPEAPSNVAPILPTGKNQGKSVEEMNEGYQKWLLKNMDGKPAWAEVITYLKGKGLSA